MCFFRQEKDQQPSYLNFMRVSVSTNDWLSSLCLTVYKVTALCSGLTSSTFNLGEKGVRDVKHNKTNNFWVSNNGISGTDKP